ncbi:MAG: hypothetical protein AAF789_02210 [Bacteroidota bacterium]
MNYKIDEEKLIAYLYDELSKDEKDKVRQAIDEDADSKRLFDELKEASFLLGNLQDQEVNTPKFSFQHDQVITGKERGSNSWWKYPMGIAASIILVLLFGYLTSFEMQIGKEGLQIAFDQQEVKAEIDSDTLEKQFAEILATNAQRVDAGLAASHDQLLQKINVVENAEVDEKLLNEYLNRLRNFNKETVQALLEESAATQQRYTDEALKELALYLDIQRQNDLEILQTKFESVEYQTQFNQNKTNRILTNLMGSTGEETINQY